MDRNTISFEKQIRYTNRTYHHDYKKAFKALNEEWIEKYLVLEASDKKSLNYPQESIINKGGEIYFALHDNIAVGVCALVKADHPQYISNYQKWVSLKGIRVKE